MADTPALSTAELVKLLDFKAELSARASRASATERGSEFPAWSVQETSEWKAARRLEAQQAEIARLKSTSADSTAAEDVVEAIAEVIYETLCASTDPGTSGWYRSIDRPEFITTAHAVLASEPIRELVEGLRDEHKAIDQLFAQLIEQSPRDNTFYPSQSAVWPAVQRGWAILSRFSGKTDSVDAASVKTSAAIARTGARDGVIAEIAAERRRQVEVEVEGWTPEHDDSHRRGEMALAAACYAAPKFVGFAGAAFGALPWPWDRSWWKPRDVRRNLVRAGALIVAEIERLDRQHASATADSPSEAQGVNPNPSTLRVQEKGEE